MSEREKLKFTRTINNLEDKNPQKTKLDIKRQKAKESLMIRFNLSEREAEEKLMEIERKAIADAQKSQPKKENNNPSKPQTQTLKRPKNYSDSEPIVPQHVFERQEKIKKEAPKPVAPKAAPQGKAKKPEKELKRQPLEKIPPRNVQKKKPIKPTNEKVANAPAQKAAPKTVPKQAPAQPKTQQKPKQAPAQPKTQQKPKQAPAQPKTQQKVQQKQTDDDLIASLAQDTTQKQKPVQPKKEAPKQPKKAPVQPKKAPVKETAPRGTLVKVDEDLMASLAQDTAQKQKVAKPREELTAPPVQKAVPETKPKEPLEFEKDLPPVPVPDTPKKAKKSRFSNLFHRNKKDKEDGKSPKPEQKGQDVDDLIGGIVQSYGDQVSIEVKNVDLCFTVQEDQIDNLKEQIIRTIKRDTSKSAKIHVLKDVSFKIYQGEKVGVIGYNAAGKSTLLKTIVGIYKPDNGTVVAHGKISPLLTLGAGFDNNFSGAKNIYLNGAILGYDKEFIDEKFDEIVEFADLGDSINYPIRNYSSGMKAKLGFSVATMVDPDILIIDEILGVGDVNFKRKSRDKMRSLMGGKTTVLLVSHSIAQIRDICDKAIWIDQGRVREIGEVNEVCDHYLKDSKKATKEQLKNIQFS